MLFNTTQSSHCDGGEETDFKMRALKMHCEWNYVQHRLSRCDTVSHLQHKQGEKPVK